MKRDKGQKDVWRRVFIAGVCIFAVIALTVPRRGHSSGIRSGTEGNLAEKGQKGKSADRANSKENFSGEEKREEAVENGKRRVLEARSSLYEIYVQEGEKQKLYVYNTRTGQTDSIKIEPDMATEIMSLKWLAPGKAAVFSHVNPSTGYLSIYGLDMKELLFERYCSSYAWHDSLESLVYVEPAPHFSEKYGEEKILNWEDRVLYQTGKKEVISEFAINSKGDMAVVTIKNPAEEDQPVNQILYLKKKGIKYRLTGRKRMKRGKRIYDIKWLDDKRISFCVNGKIFKMPVDEM